MKTQNYTIKLINIENGRNAGSESSHSWVRIISSLGPNRLGAEKYQESGTSWGRIVRLPYSIPMVLRPSVVVRRRQQFQTWISLKPVEQSWSNFMSSISGLGERLHKVSGQIWSKLCFPWQQKFPLTYNGENDVSTVSRLFLIRSFLYLQVTRTCIYSRMSSNFGQIRPLTSELAALERLKFSMDL